MINYNFKVDGSYESVNYYRSELPLDINNMPVPIAVGISGNSYADTTAELDKTYHVIFSSISGQIEKFSEQITVNAQSEYHPSWSNVLSVIIADASVLPSSDVIDKKGLAAIETTNKPTQVHSELFGGDKAFLSQTNESQIEINSSLYAFGLRDFVNEFEYAFSVESLATSWTWVLSAIGSIYGLSGLGVRLSLTNGILELGVRQSTSSTATYNSIPIDFVLEPSKRYHFAIMRKDSVIYIFADGKPCLTYTSPINLTRGRLSWGLAGGATHRYFNSIRVSNEAFYPISGFNPPSSYPLS